MLTCLLFLSNSCFCLVNLEKFFGESAKYKKNLTMLSQLKSYLFGATDGVMMEEPASEGECKTNGEDDWVLVDTQGKWAVITINLLCNIHTVYFGTNNRIYWRPDWRRRCNNSFGRIVDCHAGSCIEGHDQTRTR